ncbi:hypothetical protein M404DRAFT_27727 [Pisolithus tinctorius Marx 270]|uniref:Uncharacterized protein n=1 Tax=Pisolithus tinctorius Marx 270 TaxID=870435 RepID=A0A0C3J1C9_PISTI|nr:hypothetical protein M404DRAFT_27727 [Pisolithus tinctorius Marx 270]
MDPLCCVARTLPSHRRSLFTTESACLEYASRLLLLISRGTNMDESRVGHGSVIRIYDIKVSFQETRQYFWTLVMSSSGTVMGSYEAINHLCSLHRHQYWDLPCLLSIVPTDFRPSSGSCEGGHGPLFEPPPRLRELSTIQRSRFLTLRKDKNSSSRNSRCM